MACLTFDLIVRPWRGWQRLAQGTAALEQPLLTATGVAALSVGLALLGAIVAESATVGRATVILLATTAGYVGAGTLAVRVAPSVIADLSADRATLACYAGAASLPALSSGMAYLAPWKLTWWIVALAGCALTGLSATVGARVLLRQRVGILRTAVTPTALASVPVLAVAAFRSVA